MSIIRFIGDVHGKFSRYKKILTDSPHKTIQVGDMGVGFRKWPHGEWTANPPFDLMVEKDARFIRGNHDNPQVCKEHKQCIQDGTVEGPVEDCIIYAGGGLSIDRAYRYKDFSWWPDEELPQEALLALLDRVARYRPKMMVTHECPETIAEMIVNSLGAPRNGWKKLDPHFASRTRVAFESIRRVAVPKLWLFGHWHVPFDRVVDGTRFICLPELATLDVDTERAEPNGDVIMQREKW